MIDEGRNKDWFASTEIVVLGIVSLVGFLAFLFWEMTEKNPIVNLRIFRHRGFTAAAITYSAGFGAFFASLVIFPLWLPKEIRRNHAAGKAPIALPLNMCRRASRLPAYKLTVTTDSLHPLHHTMIGTTG